MTNNSLTSAQHWSWNKSTADKELVLHVTSPDSTPYSPQIPPGVIHNNPDHSQVWSKKEKKKQEGVLSITNYQENKNN